MKIIGYVYRKLKFDSREVEGYTVTTAEEFSNKDGIISRRTEDHFFSKEKFDKYDIKKLCEDGKTVDILYKKDGLTKDRKPRYRLVGCFAPVS